MKPSVFILDDEKDIAELVSLHLERNGFGAHAFYKPAELFARLSKELPTLVILDLMLPDMDGIEICKRIRADERTRTLPIIMLTAKREETDTVLGLELGADDYVTKPFSPKELVARVKAVLRRGANDRPRETYTIQGVMTIDLNKHAVYDKDGKAVSLTNTEFRILAELVRKRGWVLTREMLLAAVWGSDAYVIDRNIDVHIRHLREKLGDAGSLILNVRGMGYKIEE